MAKLMRVLQLVLATSNAGKVRELRALLGDLPVRVETTDAWPDGPHDVTEDAPDLRGNARKKARAWHRHTGLAALADDTGLEVRALDGRPGVRSARFAGPNSGDDANCARLLRAMDGQADRRARFRTVAALVDDDGSEHFFEGVCEGSITTERRGEGGFGYDPLFQPEGRERTFAQLDAETKNEMSHRGRALRKLRTFLYEQFAP